MKADRDTKIMMGFAIACFVAAAVFATSCRLPPPGTTGRKLIDCATDAVKQNGIGLIAPVNTCLTGGDVQSCLLGLINPAAGITYDVLACVVRREGAEFAAAEAINANDTRSRRGATSARQWIAAEQIEFTDGK